MVYEVRALNDGVYVVGPHAVPFWPGNFSPLEKRFGQIAETIEGESFGVRADVQRLISQISMDRRDFDIQPEGEKTAWLINMPVIQLSPVGSGLLVYSPLPLDDAGVLKAKLDALGPVRVVVAPSGAHTLGLASFRRAYPDAVFICPRSGGLLRFDLFNKMPEIGFRRAVASEADLVEDKLLSELLGQDFDLEVTRDNAIFEIMLYHRPSGTVLTSDTIYKTDAQGAGPGPGGPENVYLSPAWFASAYQALNLDPSPNRTLPDNRVFLARHPEFDSAGCKCSLERVLSWDIHWLVCCHTDPISGAEASRAIHNSWGWLLDEREQAGQKGLE